MLVTTVACDPWSLHAMSSPTTDNPTVNFSSVTMPRDVQFKKVKRTINRFDDIPGTFENGHYYWPSAGNFLLFDGFTTKIRGSLTILWVIQIMTSHAHRGSRAGYLKVCQIVKNLKKQIWDSPPPKKARKANISQSVPTPSVEVRYLLIVPKGDDIQGLRWSFPAGWTQGCTRG